MTDIEYYIRTILDHYTNLLIYDNGETVLPFELNHLVPEVYELANKLISKSEKI